MNHAHMNVNLMVANVINVDVSAKNIYVKNLIFGILHAVVKNGKCLVSTIQWLCVMKC